jgi:hypothetical protein
MLPAESIIFVGVLVFLKSSPSTGKQSTLGNFKEILKEIMKLHILF